MFTIFNCEIKGKKKTVYGNTYMYYRRFIPLAPHGLFRIVAYIIHILIKEKSFNCVIFTLSRYKNTNKKHTYRQGPPNDSPPLEIN